MIKQSYKRFFTLIIAISCVALVLMQLIPSSYSRVNPPVTGEPAWNSSETRELFFNACADCHSNETRYPWYSTIAPISWMIENDVQNGRARLNVSTWDRSQRGGVDAADAVQRGAMPTGLYLMMHHSANYNSETKRRFVDGLQKTFSVKESDDQ